jgi:cell division protein FtsL
VIRTLNVIALVVAVALAAALYIAKTEAKSAQERLETIQAQLAEERRQINVLNVEIAHLEEPERLRQLARQYLGFEPLDPAREITMNDLPLLVDRREDEETLRGDMVLAGQTQEELPAQARRAGGPR